MHNAATPPCSSKIHMRDVILTNHYTETFFMGFDRVKKREKESLRDSINSRYITVFTKPLPCIFRKVFSGNGRTRIPKYLPEKSKHAGDARNVRNDLF